MRFSELIYICHRNRSDASVEFTVCCEKCGEEETIEARCEGIDLESDALTFMEFEFDTLVKDNGQMVCLESDDCAERVI